MELGLQGKVALITGGSRGIGKAIALGLAVEGCALALVARGQEALDGAAEEAGALGVKVTGIAGDITDPKTATRTVDAVMREYGRVDILVNNAGGNLRGPFVERSDADWDEILELNLKAHVRMSRAALVPMRTQKSGSILFISSVFGREAGGRGLALYNTTKSALISLAKIMATELAPEGIRVNSIAPGSIRHPGGSWDRRVKEDPEGMKEFVAENIPLGRFGTAEEVADLAVYLSSDRASLITGACINVDGGQSRSLI